MKKIFTMLFFLVVVFSVGASLSPHALGMSREVIDLNALPQAEFEVTRWMSDARGLAYVLDNLGDEVLVEVSRGLGNKKAEGLRRPQDYFNKFGGTPKVYKFREKENENVFGYVLASPRLLVQTRYQKFRNRIVVRISDPQDAYHRGQHEGLN